MPNGCNGPEIVRFERPVVPGQPKTFSYAVQVHHGADADSPFIVFMPGGPGYTTINTIPLELLPGLNYVLTDQRSTGCNVADDNWPDAALTTDILAEDVADAVVRLNLKNYVLFDHSFGTVHAT
jgi:pimeloyl-ACP methyl ester carboxylesterase